MISDRVIKMVEEARKTASKKRFQGKIINKGGYGVSYGAIPNELRAAYVQALAAKNTEESDFLFEAIEDLTYVHACFPEKGTYGMGWLLGGIKKNIAIVAEEKRLRAQGKIR